MRQKVSLVILIILLISQDAFSETVGIDYSFSMINRFQISTNDFNEVDDSRNFTSEALFSESFLRLNRRLTKDELKQIARNKTQYEIFNILSFDFGFGVDFLYKYRDISDSQITDYYHIDKFNDVDISEYGLALRKDFQVDGVVGYVRAAYKYIEREGLIEFLPDANEDVNHYELDVALTKKMGENFFTIYPIYVYQDIELKISDPYERSHQVIALPFSLKAGVKKEGRKLRSLSAIENLYERKYDMREAGLFGGVIYDKEVYGDTDVVKYNYFVGTSLALGGFDLVVQPTVFTSHVENDASQDNAQYRTDISLYYNLAKDLVLSLPFSQDIAIDGPDYFENVKAGVELRYVSDFVIHEKKVGIVGGLEYGYQNFYTIGKGLNQISAELSVSL